MRDVSRKVVILGLAGATGCGMLTPEEQVQVQGFLESASEAVVAVAGQSFPGLAAVIVALKGLGIVRKRGRQNLAHVFGPKRDFATRIGGLKALAIDDHTPQPRLTSDGVLEEDA